MVSCRKIFPVVLAALLFVKNFSLVSATVKLGDSGDEVKEVQICLIAQELLDGDPDGICGDNTVQAIKNFQMAVGLPVDGICGDATIRLLRAAAFGQIDIRNFMVNNDSSTSTNEVVSEVGDVIKFGSRGSGVVDVQRKLIALGFLSGEADGICGESTVQAIKSFQESMGMTADGICGIMTYAALENSQYENTEYNFNSRSMRKLTVDATAYCMQEGLGIYTALGTPVRHGVIAVDPFVIPLGSRVYIPGYGEAVAEDTGDDIVGHRIDLAFDTYDEAISFGRKTLEIYIIED